MARAVETDAERSTCTHKFELMIDSSIYLKYVVDAEEFLAIEHRKGVYNRLDGFINMWSSGGPYKLQYWFSDWLTCFEFSLWHDAQKVDF